MQYIISLDGKSELTEGMKNAVMEAFTKVDEAVTPIGQTVLKVVLTTEKNRAKAEASIRLGKHIVRAECREYDMYEAIKKSADKMLFNIRKYRDKLVDKHGSAHKANRSTHGMPGMEKYERPDIVREKEYSLLTMTAEEACEEMELSDHAFFVFKNAETGMVSIAYCRTDGKYGVINTKEED